MAAKIQTVLNKSARLIPGGGGEFEVTVDGSLIYSKRHTKSFPVEDDLVNKISGLR